MRRAAKWENFSFRVLDHVKFVMFKIFQLYSYNDNSPSKSIRIIDDGITIFDGIP